MKDLLCASPIQRANSTLSLALQDNQPDAEPEEDAEPAAAVEADAEAASMASD